MTMVLFELKFEWTHHVSPTVKFKWLAKLCLKTANYTLGQQPWSPKKSLVGKKLISKRGAFLTTSLLQHLLSILMHNFLSVMILKRPFLSVLSPNNILWWCQKQGEEKPIVYEEKELLREKKKRWVKLLF